MLLYSIGKDSSMMLHLARKAFFPGSVPFPLLHTDTGFAIAGSLLLSGLHTHRLDSLVMAAVGGTRAILAIASMCRLHGCAIHAPVRTMRPALSLVLSILGVQLFWRGLVTLAGQAISRLHRKGVIFRISGWRR